MILSPNLMDLVVLLYLYGRFDAWPINTEFLEDDRAIFRVGVFRSLAFHCKILSMPWYFDRTHQKIYDIGKVKLKIKWPGYIPVALEWFRNRVVLFQSRTWYKMTSY
jgi:hypothetical protein